MFNVPPAREGGHVGGLGAELLEVLPKSEREKLNLKWFQKAVYSLNDSPVPTQQCIHLFEGYQDLSGTNNF